MKTLICFCSLIDLVNLLECRGALGLKNYAISNGHISASTEYDSNHAAYQGRLWLKTNGHKQGSWSARTLDQNQWLQIDLGSHYTRVTRVATQGGDALSQWVTKYKLQYGEDGASFQYYREQGQHVDKVEYTLYL